MRERHKHVERDMEREIQIYRERHTGRDTDMKR